MNRQLSVVGSLFQKFYYPNIFRKRTPLFDLIIKLIILTKINSDFCIIVILFGKHNEHPRFVSLFHLSFSYATLSELIHLKLLALIYLGTKLSLESALLINL
jgi:hypothetical protein